MTLHELDRRLQAFDLEREIVDIIEHAGPLLGDYVRGQLAAGYTAVGEITNRFTKRTTYSLWWEVERRKAGKQVDHFDLNFTGAFYRSIDVDNVTSEQYEIAAVGYDSQVVFDLTNMFGEEILQMGEENINDFVISYFHPELKRSIQMKVGLKFGS